MILSIIIPVYNVGEFLSDCLDSVLACDLADCEIILVLRPSTDGSEEICRAYQQKYPCIRVVRQEGKGLSNARNCAACIANGAYILFVDSDDNVDSLILNKLIGKLRSGTITEDVVVTDFRRIEHQSGKIRPIFQIGADTPDTRGMQFAPQFFRQHECFWNVWRYLYKRRFLTDHQIFFMENMLSEDIDFTTSVFLAEPEILFTHSPFYFYNVDRGNSLMDIPTLRRLKETVFVLTHSIERLRNSRFPYREIMAARYQFEYILNIALAVEIEPSDRPEALSLFRDHESILKNSEDPLVRLFAGYIRLFGIPHCARFLHRLKIIRRQVRGKRKAVKNP